MWGVFEIRQDQCELFQTDEVFQIQPNASISLKQNPDDLDWPWCSGTVARSAGAIVVEHTYCTGNSIYNLCFTADVPLRCGWLVLLQRDVDK